ncbi:MAG: SPFH domain-containing protein [Vulcanimicrobiota bacterium]
MHSLIIAGVLASALLIIIGITYKRVGPGETFVIYGLGRTMKIVSGPGGCFVLPLLQSYRLLLREIFVVKVEASEIPLRKGITVNIEATARLKLKDDEESLIRAATTIPHRNPREKTAFVTTIIEEAVRQILRKVEAEKLVENSDSCAREVQQKAGEELDRSGFSLFSFTFTDIKDKEGYLTSLRRRITAEEKARLAIEEAYISREGKSVAMLIKRDAAVQQMGENLEQSLEQSKDYKLDKDKVMQQTEDYMRIMKTKLDKGIKDMSKTLYSPGKTPTPPQDEE